MNSGPNQSMVQIGSVRPATQAIEASKQPRSKASVRTEPPRHALTVRRDAPGDDLHEQQIVDAEHDLEGGEGEEAEDDGGIGQESQIDHGKRSPSGGRFGEPEWPFVRINSSGQISRRAIS